MLQERNCTSSGLKWYYMVCWLIPTQWPGQSVALLPRSMSLRKSLQKSQIFYKNMLFCNRRKVVGEFKTFIFACHLFFPFFFVKQLLNQRHPASPTSNTFQTLNFFPFCHLFPKFICKCFFYLWIEREAKSPVVLHQIQVVTQTSGKNSFPLLETIYSMHY